MTFCLDPVSPCVIFFVSLTKTFLWKSLLFKAILRDSSEIPYLLVFSGGHFFFDQDFPLKVLIIQGDLARLKRNPLSFSHSGSFHFRPWASFESPYYSRRSCETQAKSPIFWCFRGISFRPRSSQDLPLKVLIIRGDLSPLKRNPLSFGVFKKKVKVVVCSKNRCGTHECIFMFYQSATKTFRNAHTGRYKLFWFSFEKILLFAFFFFRSIFRFFFHGNEKPSKP